MRPATGEIAISREVEQAVGGVRVLRPEALADVPGLVAGITARAPDEERGGPGDFGLSTGGSAWAVAARYEALAVGLGLRAASVCRQVHGTRLVTAGDAPSSGLWIPGEADGFVGFAGGGAGRLFAVTVADCAPVYLVDPDTRAFALLHAGWRGAAAGILGRALDTLRDTHGRPPSAFRLHIGPAICGDCYEVGPEVPRAFGRLVDGTTTIDIGAELVKQARALGVASDRISRSALCSRCDGRRLHSHRGGGERAGRMAAWLGWIT
ncbi:MAG TPA: polyphenol oxidase family protein [Gemmatimonadota bacterium]|nr:polyphenol oxidase family protein [Gemmatimonadota bacterium]